MQNRKAITQTAVLRRIQDSSVVRLAERRDRRGRRYEFSCLLFGLMFGMITAARSLRQVETLLASLSRSIRKKSGIRGRISDTKLRDTLLSLRVAEVRPCLIQQIKAEHRRGQLAPVHTGFGVVAIDGKSLGKVDDFNHPDIQRVQPKGRAPYGLARVHRAHLVSSKASVCIDQRPIPGSTNEIGAMGDFVRELIEHYGHTTLFELIMADAGNCSAKVARQIAEAELGYMLRLESNHGGIYDEACRQLDELEQAEFQVESNERGQRITYRLWRINLEGGWMNWESARQVLRIERVVKQPDGTLVSHGFRHWITNLQRGRLATANEWLKLGRRYWRSENDGHWTSDVFFREDARRTPWTKNPEALYVMSFLRAMGQNIVAVLRQMVRQEWTQKPIPWREALFQIELMLRRSNAEVVALS